MRALVLTLAVLMLAACQTVPPADRGPDVMYVPTPQTTVDAMLALAEVRPGDVLYDLGSGDGRIPIAAAVRHGVRGVGVEIQPQLITEARANAKAAGVARLARFQWADMFTIDFSEATVVTLYLLPELNERLKPKLRAELKPGARIVSHVFDMGDWPPEKTVDLGGGSVIYLWRIPERPVSPAG